VLALLLGPAQRPLPVAATLPHVLRKLFEARRALVSRGHVVVAVPAELLPLEMLRVVAMRAQHEALALVAALVPLVDRARVLDRGRAVGEQPPLAAEV